MQGILKSVLIVDDDRSTADIIMVVLQSEGYHLKHVSNGQHCLNPVSHVKPDLIILDVMMPVMDGYTVAARLAEVEETRRIPILILSAKSQMQDMFGMSGN